MRSPDMGTLWGDTFGISLFELACNDREAWKHILENDFEFLNSTRFQNLCHETKTRVLAQCAGLVEIEPSKWGLEHLRIDGIEANEQINLCFQRTSFIHRSVKEFLLTERTVPCSKAKTEGSLY